MKDIILALIFVLFLDGLLFLTQIAITDINPASDFVYFESSESWIESYNMGDYSINDSKNSLPDTDTTVSTDSNVFSDVFAKMGAWVKEVSFISNVINVVPNFLKHIGLAPAVSFMLGVIWHCLTFFLVVMLIRGDT